RMFRSARFALHLITVLLVVVTTIRAVSLNVALLPAMLVACAFLAGYAIGATFARTRFAGWWLGALSILWLGMLFVSAEFVWLAFPLLLLAGHLLRTWPSVIFAVPVL